MARTGRDWMVKHRRRGLGQAKANAHAAGTNKPYAANAFHPAAQAPTPLPIGDFFMNNEACYWWCFVKPLPAPIWFVAAFIPMAASQVLRLHQHDPGGWLFWDYAGRLAGLAVLAAMAWPVAFRREKLRMPWMQIPLWVLGIVLADHYLATGLGRPATICSRQQFLDTTRCQGLAALVRHPVRHWPRHLHRGSRLSTMCSARVQAVPRRRIAFGVGHIAAVRRLSLVVGGRKYPSSCAYGRSVHVVLAAVWIVVASRAQPLSNRHSRLCLSHGCRFRGSRPGVMDNAAAF